MDSGYETTAIVVQPSSEESCRTKDAIWKTMWDFFITWRRLSALKMACRSYLPNAPNAEALGLCGKSCAHLVKTMPAGTELSGNAKIRNVTKWNYDKTP